MTAPRLTTFTHQGLVFDVADAGPVDGEPVVLLHGWPQSSSSWGPVAERLHAAGYRTLAPDQRGYSPGASPRGRARYRLPLVAADAAALIDAVGRGPLHVVGHDWGAAAAYALAAAAPDRVRTLTSLAVTHPGAFLRSLVASDQLLRSWYMAAFQLPALPEYLIRAFPDRLVRALEASGQTHQRAVRDVDFLIAAGITTTLDWYRAIPLGDPRAARTPVTVPTLHVHGTADRALAGKGAELNARFVAAPYRLEVLEGVSHWIPEEVPDTVVELLLEHAGPVA
jgi:pimeloyl-ACP methyl ester carboxylesterase